MHILFFPNNEEHPDAIHLLPGFQPHFRRSDEGSGDDFEDDVEDSSESEERDEDDDNGEDEDNGGDGGNTDDGNDTDAAKDGDECEDQPEKKEQYDSEEYESDSGNDEDGDGKPGEQSEVDNITTETIEELGVQLRLPLTQHASAVAQPKITDLHHSRIPTPRSTSSNGSSASEGMKGELLNRLQNARTQGKYPKATTTIKIAKRNLRSTTPAKTPVAKK